MAFLELLNVDKSFGGVKAVHNFTLTVQEGELVGLIGPNGAGKTTVFNLITGLYPVDNGQIFFQGEDLSPLKPYEIIPRGIARTFQNLRLFARVSALENVITAYRKCQYSFLEALFHAGRWKLSEAEARKRALELLDFMGLADKALQAAGTLPYGHQRSRDCTRFGLGAEIIALGRTCCGHESGGDRRFKHAYQTHMYQFRHNYNSYRTPHGARDGNM